MKVLLTPQCYKGLSSTQYEFEALEIYRSINLSQKGVESGNWGLAESRYGPVAVVSRRLLPQRVGTVTVSQVLRALTVAHLKFCDVGVVFRFSCVRQIFKPNNRGRST